MRPDGLRAGVLVLEAAMNISSGMSLRPSAAEKNAALSPDFGETDSWLREQLLIEQDLREPGPVEWR